MVKKMKTHAKPDVRIYQHRCRSLYFMKFEMMRADEISHGHQHPEESKDINVKSTTIRPDAFKMCDKTVV